MKAKDINFEILYQLVQSVPEYMNITGIELEPTYKLKLESDANFIQKLAEEQSLANLVHMCNELKQIETNTKALKGSKKTFLDNGV